MTNKPDNAIVRTMRGLCDMLFDEIDLLRRGKISVARANAVARMAEVITSVSRFGALVKVIEGRVVKNGDDHAT